MSAISTVSLKHQSAVNKTERFYNTAGPVRADVRDTSLSSMYKHLLN